MDYLEIVNKAKRGEITTNDLADYIIAAEQQRVNEEKRVRRLEKGYGELATNVNDINENITILPAEATDIQKEVKRKGVEVLGGKKSRAYKNVPLRTRVYRDIHFEVKRQYGLITDTGRQLSYTKLKRKYADGAIAIIKAYDPPISIANEIDAENDLDGMDDV